MAPHVRHTYLAEIRCADGAPPRTRALSVDWTPALEWWRLQRLRRGQSAACAQPCLIQPRWGRHAGASYVRAVRLSHPEGGSREAHDLPLTYFAEPVRQAVRDLVREGQLPEGSAYRWRIRALDREEDDALPPASFSVDAIESAAPALATRPLRELLARAVPHQLAHGRVAALDFPVLIPRAVLDETDHHAVAAGELEAGGVLLGHLWRDPQQADLMLEITAQVPAREAVAESASLRFTPRTWQAVQAALHLRNASERIVGWWHSHPVQVWTCRACAPERRARCPANRPLFSEMDMAVHRTAYPGALNVALLLSFHADPQPRHDLFGWRHGMIAARGYHILETHR